jgi:hypothetical protein
VGLRVSAEDEREGLDVALHGEQGYTSALGAAHAMVEPASEAVTGPVVTKPVTTT